MQSGAVSIQLCLDDRADKLDKFAHASAEIFDVEVEKGFTLLTIRHHQPGLLDGMTTGKKIRLLQQTPDTVQALLANN